MKRLGYSRYVAQGATGVRSSSTRSACRRLRDCSASTPTCLPPFQLDVDKALQAGDPPPSGLSAQEQRAFEQLVRTFKQVDYARLMGSRPQTLYRIADSPVGLVAWLLDHNDGDGSDLLRTIRVPSKKRTTT